KPTSYRECRHGSAQPGADARRAAARGALSHETKALLMFTSPGSRAQPVDQRGRKRYVRKIYNIAGTYTWNAPRDLAPWTPVSVIALGAGASGGGVATTASRNSTGGGAGGLATKTFVGAFARGQALSVVVGAKGAAPSAGANPGNAGNNTTFSTLT